MSRQLRRITQAAIAIAAAVMVAVVALRMTSAATTTPLPVAYGFGGHSGWQDGQVRPHAIYFGVGGSLLIRDITWARWEQGSAAGRGIRLADNCVPSCASGRYASAVASVRLWAVRVRDGHRYFSRMTIRWRSRGRFYQAAFSYAPLAGGPVPFWS